MKTFLMVIYRLCLIIITKWNQNVLGTQWEPILELRQKYSTCQFPTPFDIGKRTNVIFVLRSDNLDSCLRDGLTISEMRKKKDAKFLFWSSTEFPFNRKQSGNCFIFRNCDKRTELPVIGSTYKLSQTIAKEKGSILSKMKYPSCYSNGINLEIWFSC